MQRNKSAELDKVGGIKLKGLSTLIQAQNMAAGAVR